MDPRVERVVGDAREDPERFWARAAGALPWKRPWDRVYEESDGSFRWFVGAQTNLSWACVDVHVERGHGDRVALITHDERGTRRQLTYRELHDLVGRIASALRASGIRRGDRVGIYMPTSVEAIALMLATVRIGAIALVVFAGFGAGALGERLRLAGARILFLTDLTYRKGKDVALTGIASDALAGAAHAVERAVVLVRGGGASAIGDVPTETWDAFLARARGDDAPEVMEANDVAFILATSGTTAKPKLAVHTHGAYAVHIDAMGKWVFDLRADDVWWSTSDIGWIVGHSYIVFAPLLAGCTTIAYEGALDHPSPETFYRIVAEERVTGVFTSPTAVRLLMRYGAAASRGHDLGAVRRVVCAGEVLNAPAWEWFQKEVFADRIPVIDHMWQTETGGPIVGNPYGIALLPIKPGSSGIPLPGIDAAIMTTEGEECAPGEKGIFVLRRPFPGLTQTLWGEPDRYQGDYWERIPGKRIYFSGDAASIDADGYVWFSGRADEIIKIADHRIGTIEVETAFLRHPAVAEAGVTGRPDELRGQVISAFVVLRQGHTASEELRRALVATVRQELGPLAVIGEVNVVDMLPKTRSGKIMRRVLKAVILDKDPGDISTIEDEGSVEDARDAWQRMKEEVKGSLSSAPA